MLMNKGFHGLTTSIFGTIVAMFSFFTVLAHAVECEPQWHNSLSLNEGRLTLVQGKQEFIVDAKGRMFFDVHKVALSPKQTQLLSDYYELLDNDLPYLLSHSQRIDKQVCDFVSLRIEQEQRLQDAIPALKNWRSVTLN
ncbi:hypothetical protein UB33_16770 [Photobacterium angustum]|uniref:hypothetical protein n=1 Tax=Photobacterium angustum TaxID=661 RepID=UPI0005DFBFC0|nr:hypothetical protein [Photobacterium angustum]KJF93517.1 hypothetical protein UB39_15570 [Photobacterium angustum]KJG04934.1 hypothetical protein UB33_16770 [Photobacterium angustum]PSV88764.1 hypothetical protein CTN01_19725 [Photobacterium angustum]PSW79771.1 hypothetical protein CTN03_13695 [Photobacterium angustum]